MKKRQVPRRTDRAKRKDSQGSTVSKRVSVEEALRESQARYRMLFEQSVEAIYTYEAKSKRILEANSAFLDLLGYSADEARKLTLYDIVAHDKENINLHLRHVLTSGPIVTGDTTWRRKDGTLVDVDVNMSTFRQGGRAIVFVTARDISERKLVEQERQRRANEFAALYETARDLSAQHDLTQVLETIVERAIRLLGAPSGFIYLHNEAQGDLELTLIRGIASPRATRLQIGGGIAGRVAQTKQPLIVKDYQTWEHRSPPYTSAGYRAILEVPMTFGGELIGVLGINELGESTRQFNEDDVRLLSLFAAQASIAVYNARLFEKVRAGRESLQVLSQRVIRAHETERREIARELHDEIGQALTGVQLNLQALQQLFEGNGRERLQDSIVTIEHVLQQARDLSLNLRPSVLDDFGLVAALKWLVKRRTQISGPTIEFAADSFETRLSEDIETVCFRVAQEALTNVVRHARACRVIIQLRQWDKEVQLFIQDDGVGFDVSSAMNIARGGASMGLLGIKERVLLVGGRIEIESVLGRGTAIRAYFPITPARAFVERRARKRLP